MLHIQYNIACGQIDIGNAFTEMTAGASAGLLQVRELVAHLQFSLVSQFLDLSPSRFAKAVHIALLHVKCQKLKAYAKGSKAMANAKSQYHMLKDSVE